MPEDTSPATDRPTPAPQPHPTPHARAQISSAGLQKVIDRIMASNLNDETKAQFVGLVKALYHS